MFSLEIEFKEVDLVVLKESIRTWSEIYRSECLSRRIVIDLQVLE